MSMTDDMDAMGTEDHPQMDPARMALAKDWVDRLKRAKNFHARAFEQMRDDAAFSSGDQWGSRNRKLTPLEVINFEKKYVSNVTIRHVAQRVASLYATDPTVVARPRERLLSVVWDGTTEHLQMAEQQLAEIMMQGMPPDPQTEAAIDELVAIIQEADAAKTARQTMAKFGRTLELVFHYSIDEQQVPFRAMMKLTVRRAVTMGVAFVKLGFQRTMQLRPETMGLVNGLAQQIADIERMATDVSEGKIKESDAEIERLRLSMQNLQQNPDQIVREGLDFQFPQSTSVIADPKCFDIRHFLGADWVAEEYVLSPAEIQEIYGVDVRKNFRGYTRSDFGNDLASQLDRLGMSEDPERKESSAAMVWEIWNKRDGLIYIVCDGYPDFLSDPVEPAVWTERFWPWFALSFNDVVTEEAYPPSDVALIRDAQSEINRARQGLREHRVANRPKYVAAGGMLSSDDKEKFKSPEAHMLIELQGVPPGQSVNDVVQAMQMSPLDPGLYEVGSAFEDILRVVGSQEANLGGTSGATATEVSTAETSRLSGLDSAADDLDNMLTEIAHASGQILLLEMQQETVKEIVGPGAFWPMLPKEEVARDLILEVEAGSAGRPNRQMEIANLRELLPLLIQIPGINPHYLAREAVKRLSDRIDMDAAMMPSSPSIMSLNRQAQEPMDDGQSPGDQGGDNEPAPTPGGDGGMGGHPAGMDQMPPQGGPSMPAA